eukprot:gene14768-31379_t
MMKFFKSKLQLGFRTGRCTINSISVLTFFLCFLPRILNLTFYEGDASESQSTVPIELALKSEELRLSLVISMAAATPNTIDFFLDIFHDSKIWDDGRLQRGVLLLSLWIPDVIIYFIVIPTTDVALLVCIFHLRNALITFAVLKHLMDYGSSIFRVRPTVITLFFFMMGHILITMSAFTSHYNQHLFFAFFGCLFIAFVVLGSMVIEWLQQMMKQTIHDISDLSTSDLNINVFLIPALMFGMNYTIICVLHGGSINANTTSSFLIEFTYAEAIFTVAVFIIQGRFSRFESIRSQN